MLQRFVPVLLALPALLGAATLEEDFRQPPTIAKPYVWWHWMGANISTEGITKDLEAMKAAGIGGATIFNLTSGVRESQAPIADLPWPERTYRSPYYWQCMRHAAAEAKRLGLEVGLHNTVGYSTTGGPWVREEQGMKKVIWSETKVTGGKPVSLALEQPKSGLRGGWGGLHRDPVTFYRDLAVIAVPAGDGPVAPEQLLDLSNKLDAQGKLTWLDAPAGTWTVVRLGYGPTGSTPHPSPDELIGRVREADKIDGAITREHWQTVIAPLQEHLGEFLGDSFRHVLIDSYEAGHQNWTDGFRATFQKRFGYDPAPWLVARTPMLGGDKKSQRVIGSEDLTARFDYDLRTVVAEQFQIQGWEAGQKMIHQAKLTLQHEAYGGPFDTVAGSYSADLPMGEFWSTSGGGIGGGIVAGGRAGGRRVIGAEAFTSMPQNSRFTETPAGLLKGTLGSFSSGVNRLILHHWVLQPFSDQFVPGQGMGWWGTHFSRHQTWSVSGRAWFTFAARCQTLLQYGETAINTLAVGRPVGDSDAIPKAVFLADLTVEKGDVVLPSGRRYPVLIVPHDGALEPEAVRKIGTLLAAGATVVAKPPTRSPSLMGYPACDAEVAKLANDLWAAKAQPRLFSELVPALAARKVEPEVTVVRGGKNVRTLHRTGSAGDVFYVTNLDESRIAATLSFADDQRLPELWNPEDASIAPAPIWRRVAGRTEVDLNLPALTARFIVLRTPSASAPALTAVTLPADQGEIVATPTGPVLRTEAAVTATLTHGTATTTLTAAPVAEPTVIGGPWKVAFAGPGTPNRSLSLPTLGSWTEHADADVRYASGTGTYTTTIEIPATWLADRGRVVLDLGTVANLAHVTCNGTDLGVAWRAPYRVDLTSAVKAGSNSIAIAVTNTWHNRLVGDEQEPDDCEWGEVKRFGKDLVGRPLVRFPAWFREGKPRPSTGRRCFVTWNYVTKDTALIPAGLLGPVRLIPQADVPLP